MGRSSNNSENSLFPHHRLCHEIHACAPDTFGWCRVLIHCGDDPVELSPNRGPVRRWARTRRRPFPPAPFQWGWPQGLQVREVTDGGSPWRGRGSGRVTAGDQTAHALIIDGCSHDVLLHETVAVNLKKCHWPKKLTALLRYNSQSYGFKKK